MFRIYTSSREETYLDLFIPRNNNDIHLGICRKSTQTSSSNHPLEHELASYNFYVNRMITLPIKEQAKQHEWRIILTLAKNNVSPVQVIH
jgi:hypothetical protein